MTFFNNGNPLSNSTGSSVDLVPILDSLCNWGKSYADGKKIVVPADNNVIDLG